MLCGCTTFFGRRISSDDLRTATEASGSAQRSVSIQVGSNRIQKDALDGGKSILRDLGNGEITDRSARENISRYNRIQNEANLIERLAKLNEKSSEKIVKINVGEWYTTIWFKILIGCIILFIVLLLISYITFILRSWGILSYIRNINEGLADGMADMINVNKNIDNDSVNEEINKRIRKRKNG